MRTYTGSQKIDFLLGTTIPLTIINAGVMIGELATANLQVRGDVTPLVSNTYYLGNSTFKWLEVWAQNGAIQTSDITQKNIVDDVPGLAAVLNLDPFMFTWKNDKDGKKFAGVSAQDVEKYLGRDFVTIDRFGIYHMNYSNLIPVLIKAIQELYRRK